MSQQHQNSTGDFLPRCRRLCQLHSLTLLSFLILLTILPHSQVHASEGDSDFRFIQCNLACQSDCAWEDQTGKGTGWRTWDLALFRWTCRENCRYECMQKDVLLRERDKRPTVKYYGKWPFRRVFGMQELCSTLFSLANFVPHYQYYRLWDKLAPPSYFMKPLWNIFALAAMFTWVWSAAFHARDTLLTERMDYFGATLSLMFLLYLAIIRIGRITNRKKWLWIGAPFVLYYIGHCWYLHFVEFDYGYNMTFSLVIGTAYLSSFTAWAFVNRARPYMWKLITANIIIFLFAFFEVFDFPPLWNLLDAHAVWHAATPVSSYLIWSFLVDDALYNSYDLSTMKHR